MNYRISVNNKNKMKTVSPLMVAVASLMLVEVFFPAPFQIAGFKVEWPFLATAMILISIFLHRNRKKSNRKIVYSLYSFWLFCVLLLLIAIFRFPFSQVFVGIAHFFRMICFFIPFIWIVSYLNAKERHSFYRIFRLLALATVWILLILSVYTGQLWGGSSFHTAGVGKNSLGYTVVCFSLMFLMFERKEYVEKPISTFLWLTPCIAVCIATKSGTAVIYILLVVLLTIYYRARAPKYLKALSIFIIIILGLCLINVDDLIVLFEKVNIHKISDFLYNFKYSGGETFGSTTDTRLDVQWRVLQQFDLQMALGRYYYYFFSIYGYTAHQLFLQILYDTGVVGLGLFVNFCRMAVRSSPAKLLMLILISYSLIEVFLIQYTSLIVLGLLAAGIPQLDAFQHSFTAKEIN